MAVAELTLLGGFELRLASGEVIDLPGQKDRALLAVLAICPGSTFSPRNSRACCGATGATRKPGTA